MPAPNITAIPAYLRARDQWLVWRFENRGSAKPTKVPYQANGVHAKSNDPASWNCLPTCQSAFESGKFDGIGFVFSEDDELFGVDLDNCLDADGKPEPWVQAILDRFSSTYAEVTPSKRGFHIIGLGRPVVIKTKKWAREDNGEDQGIEVYGTDCQGRTSARYFTVTGNSINSKEIVDCQSSLEWLYQEYFVEHHEEPEQIRNSQGTVDDDQVRRALSFITYSDDYKLWIDVGMALKAGGLGVDVWERWSRTSLKYDPGVCDQKWATFNPSRIGLGTIFHLAKQHGFKFSNGNGNGAGNKHIVRNGSCNESDEWPEMIPLAPEMPPAEDYPLDALGEILGPVAAAIQKVVKAPSALCAQAVLAAANLACAGHFDIEIDGRRIPNTNFFFTVGASGERKSAADTVALLPHREHEKLMRAQFEVDQKAYEQSKAQRKKDSESITSVEPPIPAVLAVGDITIEGLQALFAKRLSRVGVFSTEAGNILGGWAMAAEQRIRTAASLSAFWDGKPEPRARGSTGLAVLAQRRVTAHFGCQPFIAAGFLGASDFERQGLLSRFLPAWPASTIGSRTYESKKLHDDAAYKAYLNAIKKLLALPLPLAVDRPGELEPPLRKLSSGAKSLWVQFHDSVEVDAGKGGRLYSIQPVACKAAEHVLRLAGTPSAISDEVEISEDTIAKAIELVGWYLQEWQRLAAVSRIESETANASALLAWLKSKQLQFFTAQDVYQKGPTQLRKSAKIAKDAIDELVARHIARPARFEREGQNLRGFEVRPDV